MGSGFDFRKILKRETARPGGGALLRGVLLGSIMEVVEVLSTAISV